jgi:YebC/PmpR family DNA-binding regulatory protein
MPRKHLIASATNKKQQNNANMWRKLAREIKIASKTGGPNPDANPRLRMAIKKALANNLSKESIEKNINFSKDDSVLEEMIFEGFGPEGLAIIICALSDNVNRTASAIRGYFTKLGGSVGKTGTASIMFEKKSEIIIKTDKSEDEMLELIIDMEIDDLNKIDGGYQILFLPTNFEKYSNMIQELKLEVISQEVRLIPHSHINISEELQSKLERFSSSCEDDDDIQWMVDNSN